MPREWTEPQRAALERLREAMEAGSLSARHPTDVVVRPASVDPLAVPRVFWGAGTPYTSRQHESIRGVHLGSCWIDTETHLVWVLQIRPHTWIEIGRDEYYEWRRAEALPDDPWGSLAQLVRRGQGSRDSLIIRQLPRHQIEHIDRRRSEHERRLRGQRSTMFIIDEVHQNNINELAELRILGDEDGDDDEDAEDEEPTYYIALATGYGRNVQYEILCGPYKFNRMRREKASLAGLQGRLVVRDLVDDEAVSTCTSCVRPPNYLHQAHCPELRE